jgi:hypothetical protein
MKRSRFELIVFRDSGVAALARSPRSGRGILTRGANGFRILCDGREVAAGSVE